MYSPCTASLNVIGRMVFTACVTLSLTTFTQAAAQADPQGNHAMRAARLCQEKKMDDAIAEIEMAILDETEQEDMYTWYTRGFIYKEHYKMQQANDRSSASRDIAVESFRKSKALVREEATLVNHYAALKYLAATYYNDAVLAVEELVPAEEQIPLLLLGCYQSIMLEVDSAWDFRNDLGNFYSTMAGRYTRLWAEDVARTDYWEKARNYCDQVLVYVPDDCPTLHNLAVIVYNRLVVARKEVSVDPEPAEENQLIEDAFVFMKRAHQLCPSDNTRQGLEALEILSKSTSVEGKN